MKRLIMAFAVATLSVAAMADATNGVSVVRRRRPSRPSGGILERRSAIPSREIGVANKQKTFTDQQVSDAVAAARLKSFLPVAKANDSSVALIDLVEVEGADALAVYPESLRAVVNLKALSADGAKAEVVYERLKKELVRAVVFVMGSGSTSYDITRPVRKLADLDQIEFAAPSAETLTHLAVCRRVGVMPLRFATYYQACREGWAPEPTNEVQSAIWKEVHAVPKDPMKIEYDPKKGR